MAEPELEPPTEPKEPKLRWLTIVIVVIVLVASFVSYYYLGIFAPEGYRLELELEVTPNAIPRSGSWSVTTSIHNFTSGTRVIIDSAIVMTATLDDGTRTIQTKNTTDGQVSFSVPRNTVVVQFIATHESYEASTTLSGPTVVGEGLACGIAIPATGASFAYIPIAWLWYGGAGRRIWRYLLVLPGLIVGVSSLVYLLLNYPIWFGTGWFPEHFYGVSIYLIGLFALALGVAAGLMKIPRILRSKKPYEEW